MPPIKAGNIAALGYNLIHHKNQLSVSIFNITSKIYIYLFFRQSFRSVYKELHADHETGAADNK